MIQNYINHVVFCVDQSGSIDHLTNQVIKVFDNQVSYLAERSKQMNQETRASVYLFNDKVECLVYDIDVLRLPSIKDFYKARGQTALIDATLKAIEDLKQTPELYGDHAFLLYAFTDGQENHSQNRPERLKRVIEELKENWTVAVYVPDQNGVFEAKKFGFPAQNIQVWSTTNEGIKEVGETIRRTTDNFMRARATGVRGTKSLFNLDVKNLNSSIIKSALVELKPSEYHLFAVHKKEVIKPFVESWLKEYRLGSAYYQLTKPEKIQAYKELMILEKASGKVYSGNNARTILGLPNAEIQVNPADHYLYTIFCQSTSVNRNLIPGTQLIVLK